MGEIMNFDIRILNVIHLRLRAELQGAYDKFPHFFCTGI